MIQIFTFIRRLDKHLVWDYRFYNVDNDVGHIH